MIGAMKDGSPSRASQHPDAKLSNPPPPIGRGRIGRFDVVYPLAQGGMASVHVGRISGMAGFEKLVAIKVIHPHLSSEESFVRMFLDEARLAARIHHPNVGEVIEVGEDDGLYYMVCELIVGQSLRNVFRRAEGMAKKIPRPMSADICAKVCQALHEAHELKDGDGRPLGLVHRDVSPRNVLVSYNGFVKLIDFGIAWAEGRSSHTDVGKIKGKMGYMPPEQLQGLPLDRRSDLFSLGVMLYLMVTGKHPFPGVSDAERMRKILDGSFAPPRIVCPGIEPRLEAVINKAMASSPDDRFATAAEMGRELKSYVHASSTLPGSWDSSNELAVMMHDLFEKEQVKHRELIRAAAEGVGVNTDFELPERTPGGSAAARRGDTAMTAAGTPYSMKIQRTGGRSRALKIGLACGAALIAALVALLLLLPGGPEEAPAPAGAPPGAAAPIPEPAVAAASSSEPAEIRVVFDVRPPEAVISVDGAPLAAGAREIDLKADGKPHAVTISAPGYATEEDTFVADVNQKLASRLEKLPDGTGGGKARSGSKRRRDGKKPGDLGLIDSPY
jgi:serine/threonine-protein kinase